VVLVVLGIRRIRDSRPIPDDFIPAPEINLEQTEEWRPATGFRYLEKLKRSCVELEKEIRQSYDRSMEAYRGIGTTQSYREYQALRRRLETGTEERMEAYEELAELKDRIARVFSRDVRADLFELEEEAEKLKVEKDHKEKDLSEVSSKINPLIRSDLRAQFEQERDAIREEIKEIELALVEIASNLKELRDFDYDNLYQELGVSPETMRVEAAQLADIQTKSTLVSQIKPKEIPTQEAEDKAKMKAVSQRRKNNIKFVVQERLSKNLTTLEEIQNFQKERSAAIKNNRDLSYDEQTEQLKQLESECEAYRREIKSQVSVYEED